jgi:hypothetical protein
MHQLHLIGNIYIHEQYAYMHVFSICVEYVFIYGHDTYTHAYIHAHINTHMCIHTGSKHSTLPEGICLDITYTHTYTHTYIYTHKNTHTHMRTYREQTFNTIGGDWFGHYIHTRIHTCTNTHIYTYMCIHTGNKHSTLSEGTGLDIWDTLL